MSDSRERFHKQRATGLGGSDIAAMLNLDPYRTAVDLWKEKTMKLTPTREEEDNPKPWLDRGVRLEPVIRKMYVEQTGNPVKAGGFRRNWNHTIMVCHPDGIIEPLHHLNRDTQGVLEIKHAGLNIFSKIKREGIPHHWQLQMQHSLCVTGLTWGAFAVLNAERWELLIVEVDADQTIQETLIQLEEAWWQKHVIDGVEPTLEKEQQLPDLPQVGGTLQHRNDEAFIEAVRNWAEAKELEDTAKVLKETAQQNVVDLLPSTGAYECEGYRVYWSEQDGRVSFDRRALERLAPLDPLKVQEYFVEHRITTPPLNSLRLDLSLFEKQGQPFKTFKVYRTQQEGADSE